MYKGYWITTIGPINQTSIPNKVRTYNNQLFYDTEDKVIYLVPRKLITDNYSIPLGINKSKWDVRPSHLHDIGCYYHQLIKVNLSTDKLEEFLIRIDNNSTKMVICKDIPREYLEVVKVGFNKCNGLLRKAMVASKIPSSVCWRYRFGVNFNFGWINTGKYDIDLTRIYTEDMRTCKWMM